MISQISAKGIIYTKEQMNESEDEDEEKNGNKDENEQNNGNIIIDGFGVISNGSLDNNNHDVIRNFILSRISRDLSKNNKNISEINNILDDLIEIPFKSSNKKTKEKILIVLYAEENYKCQYYLIIFSFFQLKKII